MSPAEIAGTACIWLFVPGDRPERFAKAAAAGPDIVVVDLEDAVAPARKDAARAHVTDWLPRAGVTVAVRINAAGTTWHDADVAALAALGGPSLVVLPKADSPETVAAILAALPDGSAVVALIETALGVARAIDLARSPGVVRLAFGSYDLAAELGVDPDHAPALAPARGNLVLASAVGGLAGPIDGVTGDVRDHERLTADVTAAAALGFAGKLCIHPGQVAPAAAALAPSPDEVDWAERVLAAATEDGVTLVDGRMVDAPVVARARRIVSRNRPTPGAAR
ncbi:HpcH/HpaI aldolase/citrate lyase family protein [Nocardioides sp. YIM B13467]|uniref:HpcH/HpaI aldolase/citrate lyase family protein n=1 Tax=Nocardioides sp. YIM B13467 TaxID=3366294 RepID=UPI00366AA356